MGQHGPAPSQADLALGKEHAASLGIAPALYRLQQQLELVVLEFLEKAVRGGFEVLIGLEGSPGVPIPKDRSTS